MVPLAPLGLTSLAVAGRGLSEGLGRSAALAAGSVLPSTDTTDKEVDVLVQVIAPRHIGHVATSQVQC